MKILHVVTQSEFGGAQRHVRDLVRWQRNIHHVEIACGGSGALFSVVQELGVQAHRLPHLVRSVKPWKDILATGSLLRLIRAGKFDLVHCHSTKAGVLGRIVARSSRTKRVVFTAHGFAFNEPLTPPLKWSYGQIERTCSSLCDKVIAVSKFDQDTGIRVGIAPHKIDLIHNGIFPEDIPQPAPQDSLLALGVPSGARCILTIGYLYKNKGFPTLVEAAAQLPKDVHLLIIGNGPEYGSLNAAVHRFGLGGRVHLPGAIANAARFLPLADVVAIPSLKEGLPYLLLEAMASAKAVVASGVGGIPEVIEHSRSGLIVPPGNAGDMREALSKLLDDSTTSRQMGREAQARIAAAFHGRVMCQRTDELYAGLS